jgi:hypothetical protein
MPPPPLRRTTALAAAFDRTFEPAMLLLANHSDRQFGRDVAARSLGIEVKCRRVRDADVNASSACRELHISGDLRRQHRVHRTAAGLDGEWFPSPLRIGAIPAVYSSGKPGQPTVRCLSLATRTPCTSDAQAMLKRQPLVHRLSIACTPLVHGAQSRPSAGWCLSAPASISTTGRTCPTSLALPLRRPEKPVSPGYTRAEG